MFCSGCGRMLGADEQCIEVERDHVYCVAQPDGEMGCALVMFVGARVNLEVDERKLAVIR